MADMTLGLSWFRLVPLVVLLWGLPAEANAEISRRASFSQASFNRGSKKFDAVEPQPLLMPAKRPFVKQTAVVKQNDIEQDVIFNVEGTLVDGGARLNDGSLYDIHLFEGQAEQIVRITLNSNEFDTFLILQDASGEELARNDDGSDRTNAEIIFRLPTTEQYRIVAKAYDANGKGAYRLIVEGADERALFRENQKAEADRLLQQGIEAAQLSQYQTAIASWQSALEIYIEIGNRQGEANALGNLGIAYDSLSDYERAIDFHQQSLEIKQEIESRSGIASSLNNL
ncbi:MAG: tetratricopeptide repeat protein, partial [Cyanobacteria bacterium J06614_10]